LTRGIPYPLNAPTNTLCTNDAIDEDIQNACSFARRRRILNL